MVMTYLSRGVVCMLINSIYEPFAARPALRGTPEHRGRDHVSPHQREFCFGFAHSSAPLFPLSSSNPVLPSPGLLLHQLCGGSPCQIMLQAQSIWFLELVVFIQHESLVSAGGNLELFAAAASVTQVPCLSICPLCYLHTF